MPEVSNKVQVRITPLMIKKILKALPKSTIHVKMAALAETMQELSILNVDDKCIDEARRISHVYLDAIFDKAEEEYGF